jgi:hypothetical protein
MILASSPWTSLSTKFVPLTDLRCSAPILVPQRSRLSTAITIHMTSRQLELRISPREEQRREARHRFCPENTKQQKNHSTHRLALAEAEPEVFRRACPSTDSSPIYHSCDFHLARWYSPSAHLSKSNRSQSFESEMYKRDVVGCRNPTCRQPRRPLFLVLLLRLLLFGLMSRKAAGES